MLVEIANVLTPDEVRHCRALLDRADWRDGRHTAGELAARVKANQQLGADDPLGRQLGDFILERLPRAERFIAAALPLKVVPPRFNRYADAGTYGDHVDNAVFSIPGTSHRVRSDLSATLFFSDPGEYDGGDLVIRGETGAHRVKLPAGHMVLYGGNTVHHVTPVTRGARLAAFFWVQSLIRENDRRQIMLDLDDAIRALRTDAPDHAAVTPLTGVYHNLLRQWADT
ncbi:Fe2+-dependent dioxygenase [Zavarzinia compransoris]|uniref:Fe2+-dependent dioxygenase n=1 Tax=Zavarzinia compransoris TaxID=1264899 RepID=A0A317E068_9PROT|nr:Fe2+-dependent dioxygenase [Zavarzinia compransoris]PWR20467.1 Fe2+-dependent dioxygenase [Zavarzinia compransoris]TDP43890.1 PKHD-type hydroxylase [Zavarzinia compransoris]